MVLLDRGVDKYYRLSVLSSNHVATCSGLAAICNASNLGALPEVYQ